MEKSNNLTVRGEDYDLLGYQIIDFDVRLTPCYVKKLLQAPCEGKYSELLDCIMSLDILIS